MTSTKEHRAVSNYIVRYVASVINSNDADEISKDEARRIVEENGGKNIDKQDKLIVEQ